MVGGYKGLDLKWEGFQRNISFTGVKTIRIDVAREMSYKWLGLLVIKTKQEIKSFKG